MVELEFVPTILYINAKRALFASEPLTDINSPYIMIELYPALSKDYIKSATVRYIHQNLTRDELTLTFSDVIANVCPGNSTEILHNIVHDNESWWNDLVQYYLFDNDDTPTEVRYTQIYSANLIGLIFILWLTYNSSSNLFEPFQLKQLIDDDDMRSLCEGLTIENIQYLLPSSVLAREMTVSPLINLLNTSVTIGQLIIDDLPSRKSYDNGEGVLIALQATTHHLPRYVHELNDQVSCMKCDMQSEYGKMDEAYQTKVAQYEAILSNGTERLQQLVAEVETYKSHYIEEMDTHQESSKDSLLRCKDHCVSYLDKQKITNATLLQAGTEEACSIITQHQQTATSFIERLISNANQEFDQMLSDMTQLRNSLNDQLRESSTIIEQNMSHIQDKLQLLEKQVTTSQETYNSHKCNLEKHCLHLLHDKEKECSSQLDKRLDAIQNTLQQVDQTIKIKCVELREAQAALEEGKIKMARQVEAACSQYQGKLHNIQSTLAEHYKQLKQAAQKCKTDIQQQCRNECDSMKGEMETCLHDFQQMCHKESSQLRSHTQSCKSEFSQYIDEIRDGIEEEVARIVREKYREQYRKCNIDVEKEVRLCVKKQCDEGAFNDQLQDATRLIHHARDDAIHGITRQYHDLIADLQTKIQRLESQVKDLQQRVPSSSKMANRVQALEHRVSKLAKR